MPTKYRVLKGGLTYPTDPRALRKLAAGEQVPMAQRGMCERHKVGDIIDDVPNLSLAILLAKRWIEPIGEVG